MIDIDFKFPDWAAKVKARERELNLFIAANVQFNRGMLFDREGAYNGRSRWEPLKMRQGQILSKSGALRKSIAPYNSRGTPGPSGVVRFAGDTIHIGTTLIYARMMNDGTTKMPDGVLRPKNAMALKIPLGGGKFMFRKSVKIPARPFSDWNESDQEELDGALLNKITQVLNE